MGRDPKGRTCRLSLCSWLCPPREGIQCFSHDCFNVMQDGNRTKSYFHLSVSSLWLGFLVLLLWVIDTVGINRSKQGGRKGRGQSWSEEFVPCTFWIVAASIAEPSPAFSGQRPSPAVLLLSVSSLLAHWALAGLRSSLVSDGAGTWSQMSGLQDALPEALCHLLRANHLGGAQEPGPAPNCTVCRCQTYCVSGFMEAVF